MQKHTCETFSRVRKQSKEKENIQEKFYACTWK